MRHPDNHPPAATPLLTRDELIASLTTALAPEPDILAAWLGGSDATGRADDLSDVDLCIIAQDDRAEVALARLEAALEALSPIARRHRLPSPTWHGAEQCFYQLQRAPEWLLIDAVVFQRSQEHQFFDRSRHGTPRILFDPEALVRPADGDPDARSAAIDKRLTELRERFDLFAHLPAKEAQRGRAADAAHFYHGLILRPLVDLLRIRHCPDRFDFGMRYLDSDLPAPLAAQVDRLAYPASAADIPALVTEARALFHATLTEIDATRDANHANRE